MDFIIFSTKKFKKEEIKISTPNTEFLKILETTTEEEIEPSLTLDDTNILKEIDGIDALKQSIERMLKTERYYYSIYSHAYGSEINDLIGKDIELAKVECKRLAEECIYEDDRVIKLDISEVNVEHDVVILKCIINSIFGDFEMEVDI